ARNARPSEERTSDRNLTLPAEARTISKRCESPCRKIVRNPMGLPDESFGALATSSAVATLPAGLSNTPVGRISPLTKFDEVIWSLYLRELKAVPTSANAASESMLMTGRRYSRL